jgi:hypothetical protein
MVKLNFCDGCQVPNKALEDLNILVEFELPISLVLKAQQPTLLY